MQGTDELLFSLGKSRVVDAPYRDASVGKVLPEALYVQERNSCLCYRSCGFSMAARVYIGRVYGANVIKLSRFGFTVLILELSQVRR